MANPTTYFGWVMPNSADLVTDLPADFNVFGQGVDTSMQDLLGGTTGQVLSKTSATNMDFTWVTPTDQTPLTTKGDLFTFTTVDARIGVGANDTVLMADSAQATGLKWATASGMTQIASSAMSGVNTLTFSSIPQTYKNLFLRITGYYPATASVLGLTTNSGASYRGGGIYMVGTATLWSNDTAYLPFSFGDVEASAPTYATNMSAQFYNYTNAGKQLGLMVSGITSGGSGQTSFLPFMINTSSAAITSITLRTYATQYNFTAGTATLYGVN